MKYKVKAIMNFNDLEENTHRNVGDVFEVNERRKDYLLEHNAIEIIKKEKDEVTEEVVQAVAKGIIEEAQEQEKEVNEVVNEIIEEAKEEQPKFNKKKKSSKK